VERWWTIFFQRELFFDALGQIFSEGVANTVLLAFAATLLGAVLGLAIALCGTSRRRIVRWPARVYVDVLRGLPAVLVLVLIGLGLPLAGFDIFGRSTFAYGILALALISSAYMSEIIRAAIQSIEGAQMEAARSLGLSHARAMLVVVLPQALRRTIPPMTSEAIVLIKDSSLVFVLGLQVGQRDIFRIGQNLSQQQANYSALVAAGVAYLMLTIPLTRLANWLDNSGIRASSPRTRQRRAVVRSDTHDLAAAR
jgi:polar amino acid transport system permease protein